jgi:hypothetical protein
MRTFTQLPVALWTDYRFRKLSEDGKLAYLYLYSGPHALSSGVYRLAPGYAVADLGWDMDRWQTAFKLVQAEGLIKSNPETEEVLICDYLTSVKPPNFKTVQVIKKQIARVVCPLLREIADEAFSSADQHKESPEVDESTMPSYLNTKYLKQSRK